MAKLDGGTLREKTDQELQEQLSLERRRIFEATLRSTSGETVKPHEKKDGRRLIARIQTVLRERALRRKLAGQIAVLEPLAREAQPKFAKLAARAPRQGQGRIRERHFSPTGPAERSAVRLAEARRRQAQLRREDPG